MTDRRQRQKEARAAAREAKRKAASRKELWRRIRVGLGIGLVVAVVLLVAGVFGSDDGPEASYLAFRDLPTACGASAPDSVVPMQFTEPGAVDVSPGSRAVVTTSCGDIEIELDVASAPLTVASFAFLAGEGYFDGTVFHRIVENFVIQGGDQTATGAGDPGYRLPDEYPADGFVYERGVVAMANRGKDTTGSQFFIVTGEEALALSPTFTVIGTVVGGFDALDRLAAVPVTRQVTTPEVSRPLEAAYIESIEIVP
jgi:peptidylprolyl isomerase